MSAHMKSGSLRFEFEVEVNRNILVLFSLRVNNCECAEDK